MSKIYCCTITTLTIAIIMLTITIFSLILIDTKMQFIESINSNNLIHNWLKQPIIDIEFPEKECSKGYVPYIYGKLPEIIPESCLHYSFYDDYISSNPFESDNDYYNYLSLRVCNKFENNVANKPKLVLGGRDKFLEDETINNINKWRNSYTCVKTTKINYYEVKIVRKYETKSLCKKCFGMLDNKFTNYKFEINKNRINDKEYYFCIPIDEECPINFISIVNLDYYKPDKSMKILKFKDGSNKAFIYTNKIQEHKHIIDDPNFIPLIVTELKVFNEYPCYMPTEINLSKDDQVAYHKELYYYNNCKTKTRYLFDHSINYNPSLIPLDIDKEVNILNFHNKLYDLISKNPNYPVFSILKNNYYLMVGNYHNYSDDYDCNTNEILSKIIDSYKNINSIRIDTYGYNYRPSLYSSSLKKAIIVCVSFISTTILITIIGFVIEKNSCLYLFNFLLIIGILCTSISITVISFKGRDSIYSYRYYNNVFNSIPKNCLGDYSRDVFGLIEDIHNKKHFTFTIIGGINIIPIFLSIAYIISYTYLVA